MIRHIAIALRRRAERKQFAASIARFKEWSTLLNQWEKPATAQLSGKVAVVRLDDIGDYLLWRNALPAYKAYTEAQGKTLTLIANVVWKPLLEQFDLQWLDECIWVNKHSYFADEAYRLGVWRQVRNAGFYTLICPSRTRPLLLDDMMVQAASAPETIAVPNTLPRKALNTLSDALYGQLLKVDNSLHEFHFNIHLAQQFNAQVVLPEAPSLTIEVSEHTQGQVLCFIGTAAKSKTWPLPYWIQLVKGIQARGYTPVLAGGKNEIPLAQQIVDASGVASRVGACSLPETLELIAASAAVVTGDTMAAHAAVSLARPTLILANGVNAHRFVDYEKLQLPFVQTLYTTPYEKGRRPEVHIAVSRDMYSITVAKVEESLYSLLG